MPLIKRKVVQLHPTALCNIACDHCYSNSGPLGVGNVDADSFAFALKSLNMQGFVELAISGGEPTLYKDLPRLLDAARDLDYSVSLISNGVQPQRVVETAGSGNLASIAVSFDGLSDQHDAMRNQVGAFNKAVKSLEELVQLRRENRMQLEIGASVTVTKDNLGQIPSLVHTLAQKDIDHVNLHPITSSGRAVSSGIAGLRPNEYLRLFVVHRALQNELPELLITTDIYNPESRYLRPKVGDTINPIVIRENGDVVPFTYGVPNYLRLGTIWELPENFNYDDSMVNWVEEAHSTAVQTGSGNFYHTLEQCAPPKAISRMNPS